ncbi:MAG: ABC transporter permease [Clostridia bacterium]|nr:ABC transporter permease [Clostridia bacterium]
MFCDCFGVRDYCVFDSFNIFGYTMVGSAGGFLIAYLLVSAAIYGLGMLLASIAPNIKTANLLCTLVYFPMLFLSGATVPYEVMPKTMQNVVNILPLTQGIKLLKGVSLGEAVDGLLMPLCIMGGLAVLCILISTRLFKWE